MRKGKELLTLLILAIAFSSAGATVFDSDHDGIENSGDLCPKTPSSANVDRFGCSEDYILDRI